MLFETLAVLVQNRQSSAVCTLKQDIRFDCESWKLRIRLVMHIPCLFRITR